MSMPIAQTVLCPECGKEIEFTLWQSINSEIPFAMQDIISGKLFEIECKGCGFKTSVNYPLLVNDMEHGVMIYYTQPESIDETEKVIRSTRMLYTGRTRVVTNQDALREKLSIFNAELDDRVVELTKVLIMSQLSEQLAGKKIEAVYFVPGDNPRLELIFEDSFGHIPISMDYYDYAKNIFFDEEALATDEDLYVECHWANSFLNSPSKE